MEERAPRTGWWIVDTKTLSRYIHRDWKTQIEAEHVLQDLLRPYPKGHEWRERLKVRPAGMLRRTKGRAAAFS